MRLSACDFALATLDKQIFSCHNRNVLYVTILMEEAMEQRQNKRVQQTRERLRSAAHRLFLQRGYLATSIDAILAEAGISSKETLYRHYAGKEELFVDVLEHLIQEQPGFSTWLAELPHPQDLSSLRQTLIQLSREILSIMSQPEYLALVRMIIAESPRFPQLGSLFFSTITQRGLTIIVTMLQEAREQDIVADVDLEAVTRALIGGLLTYGITNLMFAGEQPPPDLDRADALVEVMIRALTP
jgi:TetR/AcrR family transcriptional regulator, mexJK operon transcriptional repressor